MRESILLGGMLTNGESWINLTKQDLDDLEKPDITLLRKVLDSNASKVFMMLQFCYMSVRYVLKKKTFTVSTFHIK